MITRAVLINDFIGVGLGLTALDRAQHLEVLHNGGVAARLAHCAVPRNDTGPMVCVGAGTGLGEVYVTNHGEHLAFGSEGGMTEFVAHDEEEWRLRYV